MPDYQIDLDCAINLSDAENDTLLQHILASELLEQTVGRTLQAVNILQSVMLSLVITDDAEMQALNRQFRQQDKTTDVLSFPLLDKPLVDAPADQLWQSGENMLDADASKEHSDNGNRPTFITPADMPVTLGDIVISWPTVRRQAEQAGHPVAYELLYLLAHGTLHLVGYDDQTEEGYQAMVRLQASILQAIDWETLSQ